MKNYYEILEVDKNASDEIIKVAYKALVKKYHPDLKEGNAKINAENKIKQINEAYDILSNPEKKYEYDQNLINEDISKEQYEIVLNENINLKKELNIYRNNIYHNYRNNNKYTKENFNNNYYNTNYNNDNDSQNTAYKEQNSNINYNNFKENISERLKTIIAICITFLIIFIIYNIPFIKDLFSSFLGSHYIFLIIIIIIAYIYFFRNKQ